MCRVATSVSACLWHSNMFLGEYYNMDPASSAQSFNGVVQSWVQNEGWMKARAERVQFATELQNLLTESAMISGTIQQQMVQPLQEISELRADLDAVKELLSSILKDNLLIPIPGDAQ